MTDLAAAILGIVCGVLAGIPTSVLLLVALSRRGMVQQQKVIPLQNTPQYYLIYNDRPQLPSGQKK